jgi:hypothetical protein
MKKRFAVLLSALLIASAIAGCNRSPSSSSSSSSSSSAPVSNSDSSSVSVPETPPMLEDDGEAEPDTDVSQDVDPTLKEVYDAVKTAYGENYIPSMMLETQQLSEVYGINMDNVESFIAEAPMMSTHVDTFFAVKAVEGKGEDVEKDLTAYQTSQQTEALQYPMNMAKVNASQVVRHGDYVFFVMLGAFDERTEATEDQQLEFAKEQIKIGVDAIAEHF